MAVNRRWDKNQQKIRHFCHKTWMEITQRSTATATHRSFQKKFFPPKFLFFQQLNFDPLSTLCQPQKAKIENFITQLQCIFYSWAHQQLNQTSVIFCSNKRWLKPRYEPNQTGHIGRGLNFGTSYYVRTWSYL